MAGKEKDVVRVEELGTTTETDFPRSVVRMESGLCRKDPCERLRENDFGQMKLIITPENKKKEKKQKPQIHKNPRGRKKKSMQFSRIHNRSYVPPLQQQFLNQVHGRSSNQGNNTAAVVPIASIVAKPFRGHGQRNMRPLGFTPGPQLSVQSLRQGGGGGAASTSASASAVTTPSPTPSDGKKMRWAAPTWTFFHIFAAQIDPAFFVANREEIMQMLHTIATTLPCPICAQHAQENLTRMGFMTRVLTQSQLKDFFYHFHNLVNRNKGYALFAHDDLTRYDTANFPLACQHFLFHYRDKSRQTKLIADDLQRSIYANRIDAWLRQNLADGFAPRGS